MRRFGRAVLLAETELREFLALNLQTRHSHDVQLERSTPHPSLFPDRVHEAVAAYSDCDHPNTPYATIAARDDLPTTTALHETDL